MGERRGDYLARNQVFEDLFPLRLIYGAHISECVLACALMSATVLAF